MAQWRIRQIKKCEFSSDAEKLKNYLLTSQYQGGSCTELVQQRKKTDIRYNVLTLCVPRGSRKHTYTGISLIWSPGDWGKSDLNGEVTELQRANLLFFAPWNTIFDRARVAVMVR